MASIKKRPDGVYRARYRTPDGREYARHFPRRADAQTWLDERTSAIVTGTHVDPKNARVTVQKWCDTWLEGYGTRRASTVRQARTHIAQITAEFGSMPLGSVRPSQVRSWTAKLREQEFSASYVYALHSRLAQIYSDAVHDGIVPRSPCSRKTSPPQGKQRPYVATVAQVWALYDAMPEYLRPSVLLCAFAGLRVAEVCGLRVADVDFMRGIITPAVQYPAEPLKTDISKTPIPIPRTLSNTLAAHVGRFPGEHLLTDGQQVGTWVVERAFKLAREQVTEQAQKGENDKVAVLPLGFRFHDLRHFYASLLIASGANVKVVQARLRHASATTTLDTYSHLWPDSDDATRTAVDAVLVARADDLRTSGKTG